jgi:hypothetical protein
VVEGGNVNGIGMDGLMNSWSGWMCRNMGVEEEDFELWRIIEEGRKELIGRGWWMELRWGLFVCLRLWVCMRMSIVRV